MLKINTTTHDQALELLSQITVDETADLGIFEVYLGQHVTFGRVTLCVSATGGESFYIFG